MAAAKWIAVVALALVAACQLAMAVDYQVAGAAPGWSIQNGYTEWAARNQFRVGDTLTFTYTGNHNVLEVSRAAYDNCDASQPIQSYLTPSPIQVTLTTSGEHWFICGVPGHCDGGMRVPINVLEATSGAPGGAPAVPNPSTPTGVASPPPPSNSAAGSSPVLSAGLAAAAAGALAILL
ncbi:mavicyanin [Selaginella moellendorffii]|uniref:mavicyanin n=1 Tax=Selaginella moellendorffii TaxID=88036 RepID=UPI000D1CDFD7|nr:mavicyanin [Selaginella moellendorffii]|eukprot:XP_024520124.1 mavicyanin [Selaginella moellendorffii]